MPTTPYSESLSEGTYQISMPSNFSVGPDMYNFRAWEDGSTSPTRNINLTADMSLVASYELIPPPPPAKGNLQIHGFLNGQEVPAVYEVAGLSGNTPATLELDPGTYTLTARYNTQSKTVTVEVLEGQTVRVDLQFAPPRPPTLGKVLSVAIPIGILYALVRRG